MIARPSSTTGAVWTSFAPRGKMRRSSSRGQPTISSAVIDSLVASLVHAVSARTTKVSRWVAGQFSSSMSAKSEMQATLRQDGTALDSHAVSDSPLASAASMRCFRNTPSATSYAQKQRFAYLTNCVLDTASLCFTRASAPSANKGMIGSGRGARQLLLTGVAVEKLLRAKLAKTKLRYDPLQNFLLIF